jgi:hypothetical protein
MLGGNLRHSRTEGRQAGNVALRRLCWCTLGAVDIVGGPGCAGKAAMTHGRPLWVDKVAQFWGLYDERERLKEPVQP